jgi:ribosomal protein S18 acetylase RimI-like enzyme
MTFAVQPMPINGPLFEGAISVYGDAFAEPPYSDPGRGNEVRQRIRASWGVRQGFRAFVAVDDGGSVIGMTYGYRGGRGQWWHDTVRGKLTRELVSEWLDDSYELVEVAVAPGEQSRGIGSALIACLLEDRPEATCVLSTRTDSRAHELYRRLGFEVVSEMRFAKDGLPFYIMGRRLH